MASLVMGPDGTVASSSAFSDKVPPAFDGHFDYASFREDVILWLVLTSLEPKKQGPALIGRLGGEAKASAKTITVSVIASENGVQMILEHLDKSYAVDATNQLDLDLANFLDYMWEKSVTVEQFIAGFHARLDKIAKLNIDSKLKGHLLLRQAALDAQDRNIIVGAASGKYDVNEISNALRQAYRNSKRSNATMNTSPSTSTCEKCNSLGKMCFKCRRNRIPRDNNRGEPRSSHPKITFYTFNTQTSSPNCRAIVDSGACSSIVGKESLDEAMRLLQISEVPNAKPEQEFHRFGNYSDEQKTRFAVMMPFKCETHKSHERIEFDIKFDVIDGNLPFLIGLPSLRAMKANMNFKHLMLGMWIGNSYHRVKLEANNNHVFLPFNLFSVSKPNSTNRGTATCYSPITTNKEQQYSIHASDSAQTTSSTNVYIENGCYHVPPRKTNPEVSQSFYRVSYPDTQAREFPQHTLSSAVPVITDSLFDQLQSTSNLVGQANVQASSNLKPHFNPDDLNKLHLQLRHGSQQRNMVS